MEKTVISHKYFASTRSGLTDVNGVIHCVQLMNYNYHRQEL